ncbi:MAG: carbamoyltransferase HypF [Tannerellaceae bacterium]|jgi:hydrogenase maturation protein HypF|nr:carbamoyltransferase HypF [Tannerellaceae bacterium]
MLHVIYIRGLVQGVGFRPFVYRVAREMGVKGEVGNHTGGLLIRAVFPSDNVRERFLRRICEEHPDVASIHSLTTCTEPEPSAAYTAFTITSSCDDADEVTQVAPDMAVCPECMSDRTTQAHRLGYPFINCTHCGPRFSIIRDLPYDRERTTMRPFRMCPQCRAEYEHPSDRRFHAQPIACNHCGPVYYALYNNVRHTCYDDLLRLASRLLREGEVIAVKGIGGYHFVCDAANEQAVRRLREIKARDTKPFAVMFRNQETLDAYAAVNETEAACLASPRRPIVLLEQRKPLAPAVNPGMRTLGVMLPYMPIHYDWFERLDTPALVMTSGNRNDLPIALNEAGANEQFGESVALVLHHTREIENRTDDSVLHVCGALPCLIRRSRGYVPEPLPAGAQVDGILAFGAEQVNTFALGKGDAIVQSQYIGDLKNWETFRFYTGAMERFTKLLRFRPRQLVCDLHPDYLSSREAERMAAATGLPLLRVQHHHAHAAACMVEYGLKRPVIAIVMDGAGLGDDGHIWGGEFLCCDRSSYRRLAHLEYLPMAGGDKAALEPWRMAAACLHTWGLPMPAEFVRRIGEERIVLLCRMIDRKVHTPLTSAAGRLFDAIASLLGLCDVSSHRAEAPVLLEQAAAVTGRFYPYRLDADGDVVSFRPALEDILGDMEDGRPAEYISARFHATMAHLIVGKARQLTVQTGVGDVVLSGGCFQNKRLVTELQQLFAVSGMRLYVPSHIPCNDSGIAAGQMIIAAGR